MSSAPQKYCVGELRPSQLLYTYGIGAVVDLPNLSVMVMGLDDWQVGSAPVVAEERLLLAVRRELGDQVVELRQPPLPPVSDAPWSNPFDSAQYVGVPVAVFPHWVVCPSCRLLAPLSSGLFQLKADQFRTERTRYVHTNCGRGQPPVVPARFLGACDHGHLDDFPWSYFVHGGGGDCPGPLRLREIGISGTAAEILVSCDRCGARRPMSQAFGERGKKMMPLCRGRNPHLRAFEAAGCAEQMRAILLGASNLWFPLSISVLSLPAQTDRLGRLVEHNWAFIGEYESLGELQAGLKMAHRMGQLGDLTQYSDEQIWEAVERRRQPSGEAAESPDVKGPEWRVFSAADESLNGADFRLATRPAPRGYVGVIAKTVCAERLREVSALVGFTRIESPSDFADNHELAEEARGRLSRNTPRWVPAVETRGEGIFLEFKEEAIADWRQARPELQEYGRRTFTAHCGWRKARGLPPGENFPGLRYVLLHSFAHALMRQLALECGYSEASLCERIYSKEPTEEGGPTAGLLIYTSAPDSEGTLGGLVSLGEPEFLGRQIARALEEMELCASDPLCAEHDPARGTPSLHWAACHACLFSPETSCERGNRYLDRALLVPTTKTSALAFFR